MRRSHRAGAGTRPGRSSRATPLLLVVLGALIAAACEAGPRDPLIHRFDGYRAGPDGDAAPGLAGTPQARALDGRPLHRLPLPDSVERRLEARLDSAEAAYRADPDDVDRALWLGRRLAYAGYYREAIEVFGESIREHHDEPRLFRHRGHRFITTRQLDRAIRDLEHAARLTSGSDDVIEPDGQPNDAGVPRSTLQTNIWYHLGLARYLARDLDGAAHAFRLGLRISPNDDMRVAMADWLWLTLQRLGRSDEADDAIAFVQPDMDILENDAYHRRLLLYRGLLPPDSLIPAAIDSAPAPDRAATGSPPQPASADTGQAPAPAAQPAPARITPGELQMATYGYGLGTWHLLRGDSARARSIYRQVIDTGYWPAFGYIAAEAALQELRASNVPARHGAAPQSAARMGSAAPDRLHPVRADTTSP